MSRRVIQIIITITAITLALIHVINPEARVDSVTLGLFVIAIIPWLSPLFKSIEVPGIGKIDYQDLEKVRDKAEKVGLLPKRIRRDTTEEYLFDIARENPNLALVAFRLELEKHLKQIAEAKRLKTSQQGILSLIEQMTDKKMLTVDEKEVLVDIITTLDEAIDQAPVDSKITGWVFEIAPYLLTRLNEIGRKKR